MRTRLILKPGQRGTKRDSERSTAIVSSACVIATTSCRKRVKTVELIVDEVDWQPGGRQVSGKKVAEVWVAWQELELRQRVRSAGGRWDRDKRVWELPYEAAVGLGLEDRIVG